MLRHRLLAAGLALAAGPAARAAKGKGSAAARRSAVEALTGNRDLAAATPDSVVFLSAGDGSGTHVAEQALWCAAGIAPAAPWYVDAKGGAGFAARVRA